MSPTPGKYNFSGKVALVTGSSSGIGAAIATQLAQYGARVAITGRNAANLEKIATGIRAVGGTEPLQIVGDLQDDSLPKKLIDQTVAKFGQLDFLVNNAGWTPPNGSLASPNLVQEFDTIFKLNVRSVVELTQLAVPHLEKTKGNVVNISSIAAHTAQFGLIYSASKAALDMVTKTSALELGPKGIRVNSINPGPVVTGICRAANAAIDEAKSKTLIESFAPQMLMKRVGVPEDIANLASFLVSDDARNITGSIMVSDSGALLAPVKPDPEAMKKIFQ